MLPVLRVSIGLLVAVVGPTCRGPSPLHLSPAGSSPTGLGPGEGGRGGARGRRGQQVFHGAQVVLLHRAVLVALLACTVHLVITAAGRTDRQTDRDEIIISLSKWELVSRGALISWGLWDCKFPYNDKCLTMY